ncbi:Metallo-dependent hydrolase [Setomelanomma holmii]|uniref:Metallo-dependent hydrolase n=1 Tax=Setomelanomma holmii TaxID=210430 RepID=A0A9P4HH83_9PLEO|nr:Metallo-dependent hydrolase [Setomelanomma holmii]
MTSSSILLKNGTVLIHDANDHVIPTQTDILVEESKIVKIAHNIEANKGVEVLDCNDKIISPGFIDTHHHGWQTQLRGRHANEQLLSYMITGNAISVQYSAQDAFYGQLAGMLEGISSGTTTVVDHAHITQSAEHARLAIAGTASSGIRSVFCYTPLMRVKQFNPLEYHPNPFEDWVMQTFNELADQSPFADGRVTLGFAFDLFFLPGEMVKGLFAGVKAKGVKTITVHGSAALNLPAINALDGLDLLDEHIIVSHGGTVKRAEAELLKTKAAHISSTPSTELQCAMGRPYCFDASFLDGGSSGDSIGVQSHASLGVDCHSCTAGSIVSEARLGLQNARNFFNEYYLKQDKVPRGLPESLSVEAAFNLATIKGAQAVRMDDQIGRIAEGYKADLVIFDALSPSMVAGAQHDPVAAIILNSSPSDIETVIVDGVIRKRGGKLLSVTIDESANKAIGKDTLEWSGVAKEILQSRAKMQAEIEKIDFDEAVASMLNMIQVDTGKLVDV